MVLSTSSTMVETALDALRHPQPPLSACLCVLWSDSELGREFERTYGVRERCPGQDQVPE